MQNKYPTKRCAHCGALFEATKPHKRFCSINCKIAHNNAKNNAKHKPTPQQKKCVWCGKVFTPRHAGIKYCSDKCKKAKEKISAKLNRGADILAAHRGVTPPPKPGRFCPNPRCSWLKWDGYGKGFCVRPVCIYNQRTDHR